MLNLLWEKSVFKFCFLCFLVGPLGHVISYEVRKDHYSTAKTNYQNWCAAWKIGHTVEWPDNVEFINEDISTAAEGLKMKTFDAVIFSFKKKGKCHFWNGHTLLRI